MFSIRDFFSTPSQLMLSLIGCTNVNVLGPTDHSLYNTSARLPNDGKRVRVTTMRASCEKVADIAKLLDRPKTFNTVLAEKTLKVHFGIDVGPGYDVVGAFETNNGIEIVTRREFGPEFILFTIYSHTLSTPTAL